MSQTLVALIGFLGGVAVALLDGPRGVPAAGLVCGLALAPAAAGVGGLGGGLVPVGIGAAAMLAGLFGRSVALRARRIPGLDPDVPVVAPRDELFGPRSVRLAGAALALVAASWVSLNVQVGDATTDQGAVFAAAFAWLVGGVRLLRARAVEDLAVGAVAVAIASGTGWILQVGPHALAEAAAVAGLAAAAAGTLGWLSGRHSRREPEGAAA